MSTQKRFRIWRLSLDQREHPGDLAHTMVDYYGASANSKEETKIARNHVDGVCIDAHQHRAALGADTSFMLRALCFALFFVRSPDRCVVVAA